MTTSDILFASFIIRILHCLVAAFWESGTNDMFCIYYLNTLSFLVKYVQLYILLYFEHNSS